MTDMLLDSPVYVKDWRFVVQQIQGVADALDFLDEWPADRHGMMFEFAQEALHSAYDGRLPITAARNTFSSWARSAGVLEDVAAAPDWMRGPEVGSGGVPG